jgi:high-affinity Fe2+/Pb2+ permease
MEDRVLVAIAIVAAMLASGGFLLLRRAQAKRAFEYRQSGRGKSKE